ncbi:MAG: hypothetical protein J6S23_01510 [Clostridia bacterium]|nr:hypothetical protein [Clostridia bacterium]
MTNFEKIKAMSVEEMRQFLFDCNKDCIFCPAYRSCKDHNGFSCFYKIYEWLESEAEE